MAPVTTPEKPRPPYFKMAFANVYNLTLVAGAMAASVLTQDPIIALAALGAEGLWLLHAPGSRLLRKLWWDPQYERDRLAYEQAARADRLRTLPRKDRERCTDLVAKQQQINFLAASNPSFASDLLRGELAKTSKLVDSFLDLSLTCNRYEAYLDTVDVDRLERDRRSYELRANNQSNTEAEREIAKKNLAVILKRIEKLREIRNYLGVARSQLDLIENSFRLIADQIVTMQSPSELSGQLDDLLDGVETVKQTAVDTERILGTIAEA
jgi:hypothetical protein